MGRKAALVAGALALFLIGAALVVLTRNSSGCEETAIELVDDRSAFVPASELVPDGSVGAGRRPVVDAVGSLGGPIGDVVAGRFYDDGDTVPALVPLGDDVVLAATTAKEGSFRAVTVPDGRVQWAQGYAGGAGRGGLVGSDFVVLIGGAEPTLLTLDADTGDPTRCLAVPVVDGGPAVTLQTDQVGDEVVTAVAPLVAPVTLARVDPVDGEVRWERPLSGTTEAGSVTAAGESVVVSRLGADPVRRAEMAAAGGIGSPTVSAYSLSDGSPTWTYPESEQAETTAAAVVGRDDDAAVTVVMTSHGNGREARRSAARLVGLDDTGAELWSTKVGRGLWSASLWGPAVVAQGPDPQGGTQLRAFDVRNGKPRWYVRAAEVPQVGRDPRSTFGAAVAIGERQVVPSPNGLLLVDPLTGSFRRLDSPVPVQELLVVGEHALVRSKNALLVVALLRDSP